MGGDGAEDLVDPFGPPVGQGQEGGLIQFDQGFNEAQSASLSS